MKFYFTISSLIFGFLSIASCIQHNAKDFMNLDSNQQILNKLPELLSASATDGYIFNLTTKVIEKKFTNKILKICSPFKQNSTDINDHGNEQVENVIEIRNFETASKILEQFCRVIPNIAVSSIIPKDKEAFAINTLINSRCSDTLVHFDVFSWRDDFFDFLTKPFPKVQNLSLHGLFESLGNDNFCLHELFPSMKSLTLNYMNVNKTSCLDETFPHLEHLSIYLYHIKRQDVLKEEQLKSMFERNQQIRNLSMKGISPYLLEVAAKYQPNLEELHLDFYDEKTKDGVRYTEKIENILFKNVKKFSIVHCFQSVPSNIHFKKLIEFHTDGSPKSCSRWLDFIEQNKQLEKIKVNGNYLNKTEFSRIAEAELNLHELSFKCGEDIDDQAIIQFIKTHEQLQKLHLDFSDINRAVLTIYRYKKLLDEKEWSLSRQGNDVFIEKEIKSDTDDSNSGTSCKVNFYFVLTYVSILLTTYFYRH